MAQLAGQGARATSCSGENPAVGSANAKMQRLGMAKLDWLVVRDFSLIECATWWKDGPEIETGELRTEDIGTEVFFLPAAAHTEKDGSFTNTQRHAAVASPGGRARRRRPQRPVVHLPPRPPSGRGWPARPTRGPAGAGPDLGLPDERRPRPSRTREAVLAEINGWDAEGDPLGPTAAQGRRLDACGCWIYCGVYADGVNQAARRKPGRSRTGWPASGAGPGRPTGGSSTTARRPTPTASPGASARRCLVGRGRGQVDRPRRPGLRGRQAARTTGRRTAPPARTRCRGTDPFIMQADGKAWLFAPAGLAGRPAADPLRAAGLAGPQPAVPPAAQPGPAGATGARDNRYQPERRRARRARSSRTCSPPTG